jgi:hypothetical protein
VKKEKFKFVKQKSDIHAIGRTFENVRGYAIKNTDYLIHKSLEGRWGWVITHLPSGCKLMTLSTLTKAKKCFVEWGSFITKLKEKYNYK